MYSLIQLKTLVCGRDPARSLPLRRGFLLIPLVLICFGLLSRAQAQEGDSGGGDPVEGFHGLISSTVTGGFNTGLGWYSGGFITDAFFNTAVGAGSLDLNNRNSNTAAGTGAMLLNITANNNTAVGTDALLFNDFTSTSPSTANDNTALGFQALFNNHDAGNNTAVGSAALFNNDSAGTLPATAFDNTAVGDFVGTLAGDESNTIRIGDLSNGDGAWSLACFIGGIFANFQPVGGAIVEVTLNLANDQLGWDIGPNQSAPSVPSRGAPARRSAPGAPAQRPTQHQAMLNDKVDKLQAVVQLQQKQIVTLTAQLKEQAAQIQKVSAQVEMIKPAPRVVENR